MHNTPFCQTKGYIYISHRTKFPPEWEAPQIIKLRDASYGLPIHNLIRSRVQTRTLDHTRSIPARVCTAGAVLQRKNVYRWVSINARHNSAFWRRTGRYRVSSNE